MEEEKSDSLVGQVIGSAVSYMRKSLFDVLSMGPIPTHIAFILDGNRRYARKWNLGEGMGHRAGFLSLMSLMKYCYELGVKYVTIYAFSIDNYKRRPDEVKGVMDLMQEKIEGLLKEESVVRKYGVRVHFIGNLTLLSEPVRRAAEEAMKVTADNNKSVLLICAPYTSTDEILHAAVESCEEKAAKILQPSMKLDKAGKGEANGENGDVNGEVDGRTRGVSEFVHNAVESFESKNLSPTKLKKVQNGDANGNINGEVDGEKTDVIKLGDLERRMYMSVAPDPDILLRSSGETRLSNFLLWQTTNCLLYSPKALWPEVGLRHLVWAVLNFQRAHPYFERKKNQT